MAISKIKTGSIDDSAITSAKVASGAIEISDLADSSITIAKTNFGASTEAITVPTGSSEQRPSSPTAGMLRYNTTVNVLEQYTTDGWVGVEPPPTISAVVLPNSQTAVTEGNTITINGTGFKSGASIKFVSSGGTQYTSPTVTRVSSTQLTAVITTSIPEGVYQLIVNNPSGLGATFDNAFTVDGLPAFTTASGSLGTVSMGDLISYTIAASEDGSSVTSFAVTSGSLPSGVSLNSSTGLISGTAPAVEAETTSSFTITATDAENQTATRNFSITVTYKQINALLMG